MCFFTFFNWWATGVEWKPSFSFSETNKIEIYLIRRFKNVFSASETNWMDLNTKDLSTIIERPEAPCKTGFQKTQFEN